MTFWRSRRAVSTSAAIPAQRSRSTPSRTLALLPDEPRWHSAVVHVEDALAAWQLPVHLARQWMKPAREVLDQQVDPLELFVQHDPTEGVVSIEICDADGLAIFVTDARPLAG